MLASRRRCCVPLVAAAVLLGCQSQAFCAPLRVTLMSSKEDYLLGEPVVLKIAVRNISPEPVELKRVSPTALAENDFRFYLSKDGRSFAQCSSGIPSPSIGRLYEVFQPRKGQNYEFWLVYSRTNPAWLAFDTVGAYWIRVRFPLQQRGRELQFVNSNLVEVHIQQPTGVDAKVWEEIRSEDALRFLHCGRAEYGKPNLVPKFLELLRTNPTSSYAPGLRHALALHYVRRWGTTADWRLDGGEELDQLRKALNRPKPRELPFPDDRRLDVRLSVDFGQIVPIEEACRAVSQITGVRLTVTPELRSQNVAGRMPDQSLRTFMRHQAYDARWEPQPKGGYRLLPAPGAKSLPMYEPVKPAAE